MRLISGLVCIAVCFAVVFGKRNKPIAPPAVKVNKEVVIKKQVNVGDINDILEKKSNDMKIFRLDNDYSIIPLNPLRYRNLIATAPRDYHSFVLFYNGNVTECPRCDESVQFWDYLARTYYFQNARNEMENNNNGIGPVYFAVVDVSNKNRKKIKLDLDYAGPNYVYYGRTLSRKSNPTDMFDPEHRGRSMNAMTGWIHDSCGIQITAIEGGNPLKVLSKLAVLAGIVVFYMAYRFELISFAGIYKYICEINYKYWCVVVAVCCVSGQVYNQVANTGLAYVGNEGQTIFIAPSSRDQLIGESVIVTCLYGTIAYAIIQLIQVRKTELKKGCSKETTKAMAYAGGYFLVAFLLLMNVIKMKR